VPRISGTYALSCDSAPFSNRPCPQASSYTHQSLKILPHARISRITTQRATTKASKGVYTALNSANPAKGRTVTPSKRNSPKVNGVMTRAATTPIVNPSDHTWRGDLESRPPLSGNPLDIAMRPASKSRRVPDTMKRVTTTALCQSNYLGYKVHHRNSQALP